MPSGEGDSAARRRVGRAVVAVLLIAGVVVGALVSRDTTATATTTTVAATTTTVATTTTTTTSVPREKAQAGWAVVSTSGRGVMVDTRQIVLGPLTFRALRMRARTTLLRWHVGTLDPPGAALSVPVDAGPSIDWRSEGTAGVVAVFNGGFKVAARAGGSLADGRILSPLVVGEMTIALNREGQWEMGAWGSRGFPTKNFHAISLRQNLPPLVLNGAVTAAGASLAWNQWGSTVSHSASELRTGLGVDAWGNLIYIASTVDVTPDQLGRALVAAGATKAMQLDINPAWPIMGASRRPVRAAGGLFQVQLNTSDHNASIYETGWIRDFFVALAEPSQWACHWASRGLSGQGEPVRAQPLSLVGTGCKPAGAAARAPARTAATMSLVTTATSASVTTTTTVP